MHTTKISPLSKRNNIKHVSQMSEYITVIFRDILVYSMDQMNGLQSWSIIEIINHNLENKKSGWSNLWDGIASSKTTVPVKLMTSS